MKNWLAVLWLGVALAVSGCGGDQSSSPATANVDAPSAASTQDPERYITADLMRGHIVEISDDKYEED